MATKLDKNIIRETTIEVDGKLLLVTLTANQTIHIKQKGRGKNLLEMEISILDLFTQMINGSGVLNEDKAMISLTDFRSQYMIEKIDLKTKVMLEQITVRLLKNT